MSVAEGGDAGMALPALATFGAKLYRFFGRSTLAAIAASVFAIPWAAKAVPVICGGFPGVPTPILPAEVLSMNTDGKGSLTVTLGASSEVGGGCPGYTITDTFIKYVADPNDSIKTPLHIIVDFNANLDFPQTPPPLVSFYVSATGGVETIGVVDVRDLTITAFTEDRVNSPQSPFVDFGDLGPVPPANSALFDGSALASLPTGLETQDTLKLQVAIEFLLAPASAADTLEVAFPLTAQLVPIGAQIVPEPSSLVLMSLGLGVLVMIVSFKCRAS
jgi:hypothetical protein